MFFNAYEQQMYKPQIDKITNDALSEDELNEFIEENERFLKEFKSKMDAYEGEDKGMKKYVIMIGGRKDGPYEFEEMMKRFSGYTSTEEQRTVIGIDTEQKKVICAYNTLGKMTFNRSLLDGAVYFNDRNDEDEMTF